MFGEVGEVFIGEIFVRKINVEVFGIELDAHQEEAGLFVGVFVGVQDVAAVAVDEVGDGGDFAFGVRAGDEEDGGVLHMYRQRGQRPFLRSFSAIRAFTSFFRRVAGKGLFGAKRMVPFEVWKFLSSSLNSMVGPAPGNRLQ